MESDIVIAGVSCRYPGIRNADHFAQFVRSPDPLASGDSSIIRDKLDNSQFCMHAHQAENCDPQIRILLECAREALTDAGLHGFQGEPAQGTIGCIVSSEVSDYGESVGYDIAALSGYGVLGGCRAMIANRISFECNLTGTSYTLATGNSLVALHNAVRLITDNRCDAVVVGCVELCIKQSHTRKVAMLGATISRVEGGGVIVLARRGLASKVYGRVDAAWVRYLGAEMRGGIRDAWSNIGSSEGNVEIVFGDSSWNRNVGYIEKHMFDTSHFKGKYKYKLHTAIRKIGDLGSASGLTTLLIALYSCLMNRFCVTACGITGTYCVIHITPSPPPHLTPRYLTVCAKNTDTVSRVLHRYNHCTPEQCMFIAHCFSKMSGHVRGIYDGEIGTTHIGTPSTRPIWLVVGGVGAYWVGMGQHLMSIPQYAASVHTTRMLINEDVRDTSNAIYNLFMELLEFQLAHIDLLKWLGLHFDGIIGHSFGEIAALYAAGALTRHQAVQCAEQRAASVILTREGAMLAVSLPVSVNDPAQWVADRVGCGVDVACVNSSHSVVISGDRVEVERARRVLEEETGARCVGVRSFDKAFHSRFMFQAAEVYKESLQGVFQGTRAPGNFISSSHVGEEVTTIDAEYFTTNMVGQVKFYSAYRDNIPPDAVVLELSPHSMFCRSIHEDIPGTECIPLSSRHDHHIAQSDAPISELEKIVETHTANSHNKRKQSNDEYQLFKALKHIYLHTNSEIQLEKLPKSGGLDEINAGCLLSWNHSQSWYVPLEDHFPEVGRTMVKPQNTSTVVTKTDNGNPLLLLDYHMMSVMQCFTHDVSSYSFNQEMHGSVLVFCILEQLVRNSLGGRSGLVVSGSCPVNCNKRSSNNFVDVFVMGDSVDVVYNGVGVFSGHMARVGSIGESIDGDRESVLKELRKIRNCKDIIFFVNTTAVISVESTKTDPSSIVSKYFICRLDAELAGQTEDVGKSCLDSESNDERTNETENFIVRKAKKILGIRNVVHPDKKLQDYGIDSLMSTELSDILNDNDTGRRFCSEVILNLSFNDLNDM